MYYNISFDDFINLNIFKKGYLYKTRILGFRSFKCKQYEFLDLYIQNHDDTYIIMTGHDRKTDDMVIEIQSLESVWDLKLHNVCFDSNTKKCIDVPYYLPRHAIFLSDIVVDDNFLNTNHFCATNLLGRPKIDFNLDKRSFKKCTSYDFLDKYFNHAKDYEIRRNKIKEDDDFTRESK